MAYRDDNQRFRNRDYRDERSDHNFGEEGHNAGSNYNDEEEKRRRSYDEYYRWGGASGTPGRLNARQGNVYGYGGNEDYSNERYEMGRRDWNPAWNRDEDLSNRDYDREHRRGGFKPVLTRHLYEDGRPDPTTGPYWPYPEGYMPRGKTDRNWTDRVRDEVASWLGDDDAAKRRETDKHPNHRGKGPKGYQRSDEKIKESVSDMLYEDEFVDASDIEVEVSNGDVILHGMVNSKYEKRRTEYLVDMVAGVKNVENRLRVNEIYKDR